MTESKKGRRDARDTVIDMANDATLRKEEKRREGRRVVTVDRTLFLSNFTTPLHYICCYPALCFSSLPCSSTLLPATWRLQEVAVLSLKSKKRRISIDILVH
jgi:hypothetical protein